MLFCIRITAFSYGQIRHTPILDSQSAKITKALQANETEQAYLVTNKSFYLTAESIWFRAYLLHAFSLKISTQSKKLFVDLVNENDSVIQSKVLSSAKQQTSSKLDIPQGLKSGYYRIRAYTPSMITADSTNAAVVPLYVYNASDSAKSEQPNDHTEQASVPQLDIFPEGGTVITGANSRLVFHLHDQAGNPLILPVHVKDNRDSIIADCTTDRFGLGAASIYPYRYRKYRACFWWKGQEHCIPFSVYRPYSAQLSIVNNTGSILELRVLLEDSLALKNDSTYVLGFFKDSLCFASIGKGSYHVSLFSPLPAGMVTFLLFNHNFQLLGERSCFIRGNKINSIVSLDKKAYHYREKALGKVVILDSHHQPLSASINIAVADSSAVSLFDDAKLLQPVRMARQGLLNNWAMAPLQGYSEKSIDNLMILTKTNYPTLLEQRNYFNLNEKESFFNLSGKVLNNKGFPLTGKVVTLMNISTLAFDTDTTDKEGRFSFPWDGYWDNSMFSIQVSNKKGQKEEFNVVMDTLIFPVFHTPKNLKVTMGQDSYVPSAYFNYFITQTTVVNNKGTLKNVTVRATVKSTTKRRVSPTSIIITSDDLLKSASRTFATALLKNSKIRYALLDQFMAPLIFLDSVEIFLPPNVSPGVVDKSDSPAFKYLNSLNPADIDYIEVLPRGGDVAGTSSISGWDTYNGIIYIHTKRGDGVISSAEGMKRFSRTGYAIPADFQGINYEAKEVKNNLAPDLRATLYWNDNVLTSDEGVVNFTFFTNDVPVSYKVIVTGITVHGDPIYNELFFSNGHKDK